MAAEPPSPDGAPLLGNTLGFMSGRFDFVTDARRNCGDVFVADLLGLGKICYVTHPDQFERVLVTDRDAFNKSEVFQIALGDGLLSVDGDQWETQRDLLDEFFYPERIRSYADRMVSVIERRIDRWAVGETRSLVDEMSALTLEILVETLFDRRLEPGSDQALREAVAGLNAYFTAPSLALPQWVPLPSRRRFRRARNTLRNELRALLTERAETGRPGDSDDLLSVLAVLYASDDAPLSEDAIIDQLITFLFAGHESTALALTYTFYQLGSHETVQQAFHEEIDAVFGNEHVQPMQAVTDLTATERILQETLRLYPPAHTIPRVAVRDVDLGGYRLRAGTPTHLALHSVHRDERFYDDPLAFRPDRWREATPESKGYAYLPFGAGQRTCIGRQFALLEARLALATIGRRFQLEPQEPLELAPRMSTQPAGDVPVVVRERDR